MKSTEEYEAIIAELKKENDRLKEENDIVWDMCNELRASDIRFNENLQNMLTNFFLNIKKSNTLKTYCFISDFTKLRLLLIISFVVVCQGDF